jgi:hypothetical protein
MSLLIAVLAAFIALTGVEGGPAVKSATAPHVAASALATGVEGGPAR